MVAQSVDTTSMKATTRKNFQNRHRYDNTKRNNRRTKRGQYTDKDRNDKRKKFCNPCCIVCEIVNPKYKCPKCRQPYCSVSCCKSHRDSCSAPLSIDSGILHPSSASKYLPQESLEIDKEGYMKHPNAATATCKEEEEDFEKWPITDEMKRRLCDASWLRKELVDGGLRHIITNIDCSSYERRKELLHKAICDNTNFRHFIDQLLATAGVLKKSENGLLVLDIPSTKICQRQQPSLLHENALSSDDEEECSDDAHFESFGEEDSDEESSSTSDKSNEDECSTDS